jgi:hypothetical protein
MLKVDEPVQDVKNKTEIKITKNINVINNINIINNNAREEKKDEDKMTNINNIKRYSKKINKNKIMNENEEIINYENTVTSTEKITLASNKNNQND